MRHAVFFDRDGVFNKLIDRGGKFGRTHGVRLTSPWHFKEFEMFDGVSEVISAIKSRGFLTILATNQPGIANGEIEPEELEKMHALVWATGIDDIRVCPHNDRDACACRKPKPGLLLDVARDWEIDLPSSYFVGDMVSDILAAKAAGCTGVLLRRPYNGTVHAPVIISDLSDILRILPEVPP